MKTLKKTRLVSSLLAATTGMSMMAMGGSVLAQIDDELQGEVLLVPYYTVRDGWTTLANITNTTAYTVVVKVRYRESYNSRDVLDFNLIMSPEDVWTGWVAEGPNGPRLYTRDSTCTTPIFTDAGDGSRYADFSNLGYQNDGGPTGIDRTREGHFEFITMGQFFPGAEDEKWNSSGVWDSWNGPAIPYSEGEPKYPTAYYAKHEDGVPRNCEMVDSRFVAMDDPFDLDDVIEQIPWSSDGNPLAEADVRRAINEWPDDTGDAGEVLKGNFSLVNTGRGIAAGAMAWALDSWDVDYSINERMTAQQFPWFLEPTLFSEDGLWEWDPALGGDSASNELDVETQNNEWSTNPTTGAATDWVITFPTKEFHTDISETDIYAGANPARLEDECNFDDDTPGKWDCRLWNSIGDKTADTFEEAFLAAGGLRWEDNDDHAFEEPFDGQSCDTVVYGLYDREEEGVEGSGTSISPAPPQPVDSLCYQSNVLSFQDESVLGSELAVKVDTSVLPGGGTAGWLRLQLSDSCSFSTGRKFESPYFGAYCNEELPAIGFAIKTRDFGDPSRNFGQLMYNGAHDAEGASPP